MRQNPREKALELAKNIAPFKPLKYTDYIKLPKKAQETYNKQEREHNFNKKMARKYGNSVSKGQNRLEKFFRGI